MSKRTKITAITIQYPDGTTKTLSVADAKALHQELDDLFGKTVEYVPSRPFVMERDRWPRWMPYIATVPQIEHHHHHSAPTFIPQQAPDKPMIWCMHNEKTV